MSLPVVLIHAFPFDGSMWRGQAEFLRARGRTVFTPDLPGFGSAAAWEKEKCSIEAYADGVRALIVKEAGGRAVVGGLSLGGYVLLALLRAHPETVAGAMLMDTRAQGDTAEARAGRMASIETLQSRGVEGIADGMLAKVLSENASAEVRGRAREMMLRQSAEGAIGAQWAMANRADQKEMLGRIAVPTLIVVGAEDVPTPPGVAREMHARIAGSRMVEIERAGHLSNLEQPEGVNGAMGFFLEKSNL